MRPPTYIRPNRRPTIPIKPIIFTFRIKSQFTRIKNRTHTKTHPIHTNTSKFESFIIKFEFELSRKEKREFLKFKNLIFFSKNLKIPRN